MIDNNNIQAQQQISKPDPALKGLEVLVGTWIIKGHESSSDGEIHGKVTFEWMEGGFFLVQHIDIDCIGRRSRVSTTSDMMSQSRPLPRTTLTTRGMPSNTCGK
jgi:hypothetical protein